MHTNSLSGVPEIFHKLTDPRDPRGVRFAAATRTAGAIFCGRR